MGGDIRPPRINGVFYGPGPATNVKPSHLRITTRLSMRRAGLSNRVCLSVTRQKSIESHPMRTVYGFKEHLEKNKFTSHRFRPHGSFSVVLAVPNISQVRSAYHNYKLRANTNG